MGLGFALMFLGIIVIVVTGNYNNKDISTLHGQDLWVGILGFALLVIGAFFLAFSPMGKKSTEEK